RTAAARERGRRHDAQDRRAAAQVWHETHAVSRRPESGRGSRMSAMSQRGTAAGRRPTRSNTGAVA
ncbi:hypothetical protein, partial [Nocardia pseudobrasiliensis]|uniref:hypothetical protein n=1 Tax=Nocardia pseudobrasiliensis TaxID=45979 RepID=UPI001C3F56CE